MNPFPVPLCVWHLACDWVLHSGVFCRRDFEWRGGGSPPPPPSKPWLDITKAFTHIEHRHLPSQHLRMRTTNLSGTQVIYTLYLFFVDHGSLARFLSQVEESQTGSLWYSTGQDTAGQWQRPPVDRGSSPLWPADGSRRTGFRIRRPFGPLPVPHDSCDNGNYYTYKILHLAKQTGTTCNRASIWPGYNTRQGSQDAPNYVISNKCVRSSRTGINKCKIPSDISSSCLDSFGSVPVIRATTAPPCGNMRK